VTKTRTKPPAKDAPVARVHGIDDLEASREALRDSGRAAMGVTGDARTEPFFAALRGAGVGIYPLTALGLLVIVDQFQSTVFQVQGPEIARALGVPRGVVALLFLLKTLAIVFAALPIAALVQNRPRRALVAR